jgi:hypothetical protein
MVIVMAVATVLRNHALYPVTAAPWGHVSILLHALGLANEILNRTERYVEQVIPDCVMALRAVSEQLLLLASSLIHPVTLYTAHHGMGTLCHSLALFILIP